MVNRPLHSIPPRGVTLGDWGREQKGHVSYIQWVYIRWPCAYVDAVWGQVEVDIHMCVSVCEYFSLLYFSYLSFSLSSVTLPLYFLFLLYIPCTLTSFFLFLHAPCTCFPFHPSYSSFSLVHLVSLESLLYPFVTVYPHILHTTTLHTTALHTTTHSHYHPSHYRSDDARRGRGPTRLTLSPPPPKVN